MAVVDDRRLHDAVAARDRRPVVLPQQRSGRRRQTDDRLLRDHHHLAHAVDIPERIAIRDGPASGRRASHSWYGLT
jgi:hypothetical protein